MPTRYFLYFFVFLSFGALFSFAQDPAPRLAISTSDNAMVLRLQDIPGTNDCTIEASTNLHDWISLGDLLDVNAETAFTDHERHPNRFYRGIWHGNNIQAGLHRNRAKWESKNMPDYDFTFRWICFCSPEYVRPVVISVRDGEIVEVRPTREGTKIDAAEFARYPTIDGLFDFLQDAIDQNAHSISAIFDPRYNFPREAHVDYNPFLVDEERGFLVSDFQPVQAAPDVQITDRSPEALQLDPFTIGSVAVDGNILTLTISYSGGCQEHEFQLFMSPNAFLESWPVQSNLYLRHNANGDLCKAWITRDLHFDLAPIAELYLNQYGRTDPINLNVFEYFQDTPGKSIRVNYLQE